MKLIYILQEYYSDYEYDDMLIKELIFENKEDALAVLEIIKTDSLYDFSDENNISNIKIIVNKEVQGTNLVYKFKTLNAYVYEYYLISKLFYQSVLDYA